MYLQFDRTQVIGMTAVGFIYWFATGQPVGCAVVTLLLILFISLRKAQ